MKLRKIRHLFAAVAFAFACSLPGQALAVPANVLSLQLDGSGSISDTNWDLQINAYVAELQNVFDAFPTLFGDTAIGADIFGNNVVNVFTMQEINVQTDLDALKSALNATLTGGVNERGGVEEFNTQIDLAINAGAAEIQALFASSDNKVIDVSTDGISAGDPDAAAAAALANGIITNCIGIGGSANCDFATNNGGTAYAASDFTAFAAALNDKLEAELVGVPEPASLLLLGLGLLGLGFSKRRGLAAA